MSDVNIDVKRLVRPEILEMKAYQVPPSQGMVKLDAMENPFDLPPEFRRAWLQWLEPVQINRYPDPSPASLKQCLLEQNSLARPLDVIFGNGSDELIQVIIQALSPDAGPVMSVSPTFVMYKVLSRVIGKAFVEVPLKADFSLDTTAMLEAIEELNPGCIFLAWPNNPTGNLFDEHVLDAIIARAPGLVVIDEAYLPFAGRTRAGQLRDHPNLLVMRTLSKTGLAGLRFGMLFGHRAWLEQFDKIRLPYNINSLTCASVGFALENPDCFREQAKRIVEERDHVFRRLDALEGVEPIPSEANFILVRITHVQAGEVFSRLRGQNILVKNLHQTGSLLEQCLRVTIGTPHENGIFLEALEKILREAA